MRRVDRGREVDGRGVVRARGVVGDPPAGHRARVPPVVVGVEARPLPVVAQGKLSNGLCQVQPLRAQGVGHVEGGELAGQRREGDVEVDSEELSGGGAVDDELLFVGRSQEAVQLLKFCVCVCVERATRA